MAGVWARGGSFAALTALLVGCGGPHSPGNGGEAGQGGASQTAGGAAGNHGGAGHGASGGHRASGAGGAPAGSGGTSTGGAGTSAGGRTASGGTGNGAEAGESSAGEGGIAGEGDGNGTAGDSGGHDATGGRGGHAGATNGGAGTTSGSGGIAGNAGHAGTASTAGNGGTTVGAAGASGQGGASGAGGFVGVGGTPAGGNSGIAGAGLTSSGGNSGFAGGAGTGTVATTVFSAESCNGLDDDGDGHIDNLGTFTCGLGACERTVTACVDGQLQHCVPGTPATGPDGCGGGDTDCDGAVDEDCGACLHVAPDGDDAAAAASDGSTAFANVQAAIDFADAHRDIATQVCVAAGPACGDTATFDGPVDTELHMADGIDVLGNYEATTFTRCTSATATHLAPQTTAGVVFGAGITHDTTLDGFIIDRGAVSGVTGVTVDGARGARLANLVISGASGWADHSFGVDVMNGADALVTRSRIDGGIGQFEIAVRVTGARIDLEDNCPGNFDANGRCVTTCASSGPEFDSFFNGPPISGSRIIELDDAPGSRIERNGICSTGLVNDAPGVFVTGDATGVLVRGNDIQTTARTFNQTYALRFEDCGGASPWVVDNANIAMDFVSGTLGGGDLPSATVRAAGACHPVIEQNDAIFAQGIGQDTRAVHCDQANGVGSRCVITRNPNIQNTPDNAPFVGSPAGTSELLRCDGGSCARIDHNRVLGTSIFCGSAHCARSVTALVLAPGGGTFVSSNYLTAGSASAYLTGIGVSAHGAGARFENNVILGVTETPGYAGQVVGSPSTQPVAGFGLVGFADVSSNYIAGSPFDGGATNTCDSYGVSLTNVGGTFRNNIIAGGGCGASILRENTANHPDVFDHNTLYNGAVTVAAPGQALGALFDDALNGLNVSSFSRNDQLVFTVSDLQALTDLNVTNTLDANCAPTIDYHLPSGSACIDAGSVTGAPLVDMDGDARSDGKPDIGPDEVVH